LFSTVFTNLRKLSGNKLKLEKSKVELSTLQSFLSVKGEFRTVVRNATCGIETKFIVIKGKINSPPLLSKATLHIQCTVILIVSYFSDAFKNASKFIQDFGYFCFSLFCHLIHIQFHKEEFRTVVQIATCGIETKFIVLKGKINSPPLLSKATLLELGMMQIRPDGSWFTSAPLFGSTFISTSPK
jgi:hypothetical protein